MRSTPKTMQQSSINLLAVTEHLVDGHVVGDDPANPVEEAESLEEVSGEQVPDRASSERVCGWMSIKATKVARANLQTKKRSRLIPPRVPTPA
jgi:hypothetical protein